MKTNTLLSRLTTASKDAVRALVPCLKENSIVQLRHKGKGYDYTSRYLVRRTTIHGISIFGLDDGEVIEAGTKNALARKLLGVYKVRGIQDLGSINNILDKG